MIKPVSFFYCTIALFIGIGELCCQGGVGRSTLDYWAKGIQASDESVLVALRSGGVESLSVLGQLLEADDKDVAASAARACGGLGRQAAPLATSLLRSLVLCDAESVRLAAAEALGNIGGADDKLLADLWGRATSDPSPAVRRACARSCWVLDNQFHDRVKHGMASGHLARDEAVEMMVAVGVDLVPQLIAKGDLRTDGLERSVLVRIGWRAVPLLVDAGAMDVAQDAMELEVRGRMTCESMARIGMDMKQLDKGTDFAFTLEAPMRPHRRNIIVGRTIDGGWLRVIDVSALTLDGGEVASPVVLESRATILPPSVARSMVYLLTALGQMNVECAAPVVQESQVAGGFPTVVRESWITTSWVRGGIRAHVTSGVSWAAFSDGLASSADMARRARVEVASSVVRELLNKEGWAPCHPEDLDIVAIRAHVESGDAEGRWDWAPARAILVALTAR